MNFRVGQKVVCVKGGLTFEAKKLRKGAVYTIRGIEADVLQPERGVGVYLLEVVNGLDPFGEEYGYYSDRFRPVVERKTDITVFTEILRKATKPARSPLVALQDRA